MIEAIILRLLKKRINAKIASVAGLAAAQKKLKRVTDSLGTSPLDKQLSFALKKFNDITVVKNFNKTTTKIKNVAELKAITDRLKVLTSLLNMTPAQLESKLKTSASFISEQLGKLSAQERKIFGLAIQQEAQELGMDSSSLSSSWLTFGVWTPVGIGGSGFLELTTKDGKTYTYPNVSLIVWESMKAATGKNGSGAGSVFWALYLRGQKASVPAQQIAQLFKVSGVGAL